MRELTFKGFLKEYIKYLGSTKTLSLYKLATIVLPESPRIAEPLYLYASITNQQERLIKLLSAEAPFQKDKVLGSNPIKHYLDEFKQLDKLFPSSEVLLQALEKKDHRILSRYQKVYDQYLVERDKNLRDRRYNAKIHKSISGLQSELGVSNYRLYKDLELNPGNINAYLKHGDSTKVSRKTANRLLSYLEDLKRQPQTD